jgi:D-alanyl-D-alanine carboxypeptidase/D-alanyl-D-alanine-endopeptidase (penicillin-binding protein 4)
MHGHKHGAVFKDSLPIGGDRIGTLRMRFGETSAQRKVASKIRGKTGSIFSTRTLSGYMTTVSGDELAYSIMFNNDINGLTLAMIDRIATLLANEGQGWK